jgi:hypothetical protein
MAADYPRKPIEVRITVNGFDWPEVIRTAQEVVDRLNEQRELGVGMSACGAGPSHTLAVQLRDVTRERFIEESIAWSQARELERIEAARQGEDG